VMRLYFLTIWIELSRMAGILGILR